MKTKGSETNALIRSFVRDRRVATVTPSSRFIVRHIMGKIDLNTGKVVFEYGAGTGVITRALLKEMPSGSRLIAFETNSFLCERFLKIDDSRLTVLNKDVLSINKIIKSGRLPGKADYIISGIPFSMMPRKEREDVIKQSRKVLSDGGKAIFYQTSPMLKGMLKEYFLSVRVRFEPRNIPPLFILEAF